MVCWQQFLNISKLTCVHTDNCYLTLIIQFNINRKFYLTHTGDLNTGTTTLGQSRPRNEEGTLHFPKLKNGSLIIRWFSVIFWTIRGWSYPSAEMKSMSSSWRGCIKLDCKHRNIHLTFITINTNVYLINAKYTLIVPKCKYRVSQYTGGNSVTANNSTNNNVVFFLVSDLKIVY